MEQSMITVTEELPVPLPPAPSTSIVSQPELDAAALAKLPEE